MLLRVSDDKSHQLAELDRLAEVASVARRRQIAEERRVLWAGIGLAN
jgi:hypothetical protein